MSVSGPDIPEIAFPPSRRAPLRSTAIGYGWAIALVVLSSVLSYLIVEKWNLLTLAPVMAAIVIMACFGGIGPTLLCAILSSLAWLGFIAIDLRHLRHGHPIPWRWPDAPWRFAQFLAMAVFISASYFARRRAEYMLRNAQQRLAIVLDESQIGTWHYDVEAGVFWLSPRMEAILGLGQGAAPGYAAFLDSIPPQDRPGVIEAMAGALENKTNYEVEHRVVRSDGSVQRIGMRGKAFVGRLGKVERIIGVGMEVSEGEAEPATPVAVATQLDR